MITTFTALTKPVRWHQISTAEKLLWIFFASNTIALIAGLAYLLLHRT